MTQPTIGFIGLGLMGSAMAGRLQDKGYSLNVMGNTNRTGIDKALARGATEYKSAKALATNSDIVMLCVGTSQQVESRMHGDDGIMAGLKQGAVVVDFGTSLPESTRKLSQEVAAIGCEYIDAPLGRTPEHAEQGLLNIMAAGDKATFDRIEPVLKDLGENVFHLGDSGAGHTIKLLNNFFAMTTANAMSEVFAMADVAGVSRESVYEVMSQGPAASIMMDLVKAYAIDGDASKLAFAVKNATKDIRYYSKMAEDAGVESFIAGGPLGGMEQAIEAGEGEKMVSQMVDFYADQFAKKS